MMSFVEVMAMVEEAKKEEKNTKEVPHYYKRNGQMVRRSYDDTVYSKRYEELFFDKDEKTLRSEDAKIFKCDCCGEMFGYWDLEDWCCVFSEDENESYYICDCCYEDGMGDDL